MTISYSDVKTLIRQTRTFRRFASGKNLDDDIIRRLIDLARLGGSARNGQPFQFMVVVDRDISDRIFPHLGWAGYLSDWYGPAVDERPQGYILCFLNEDRLNVAPSDAMIDLGIFTQNILLGATSLGLGGCRIGAFSPKVAHLFVLPSQLSLKLIVALGKPGERVVLEKCRTQDDTRYWRDETQVHHVPKRHLEELLVSLPLADKE